jgi:hypothetical protein
VKPETTRGVRRLVPRRRRGPGRSDALGTHQAPSLDRGGDHADFDPAEFADFLAADDGPLPVDPAFRERLRHELWGMVRSQAERKDSPVNPVTALADPKQRR